MKPPKARFALRLLFTRILRLSPEGGYNGAMTEARDPADELLDFARSLGAGDASLARVQDGPGDMPYALSVVVPLSRAILDEITHESGPTYTYFNHYRSVNFLIDQILLRCGLWLQGRGARYLTVAASQSRPDSPFEARYSHKKAACLSGLGSIGRNGLFLHKRWGPRVRLGTLFTDWEGCTSRAHCLPDERVACPSCDTCGKCAAACPSGAIGADDIDRARCSQWMKDRYREIGRGAVCGICIEVCPIGKD